MAIVLESPKVIILYVIIWCKKIFVSKPAIMLLFYIPGKNGLN
jgi:hypothetical protein